MDTCPKSQQKFLDSDKCLEIIDEVHKKLDIIQKEDEIRCKCESEALVEKFQRLINPYQEQPELLDPYLAHLIEVLTDGLENPNISSARYHTIFKLLYQLVKVSGFKSIGKKFPHETNKLPLIIELLSKEGVDDKFNWQTRFVLIVWLSIVLLVPFDLSKFEATTDSSGKKIILGDRIYTILYKNLHLHDSCQHVSAYCLAKFFSRSDILAGNIDGQQSNLVDKFIEESIGELDHIKFGSSVGSMEDVKLIGHLRTLAYMFKFLPRQEMKFRCEKILNVLTKLDVDRINRELINHIIIKLIQRAGLALLPKPLSSWRYKRGSRILGSIGLESKTNEPQTSSSYNSCSVTDNFQQRQLSEEQQQTNNEEEVISAEHLESILSVLFVACQNGQTRIRYSAAKGIARLSSRLSRERASDVIDMILGNFFDTNSSSEFAWHGGCLTLAEMSRNGLILEEKLEQVIGIISKAIIYDKTKGSFAVGSHVREAACYVCWAIARSYEDNLVAPHISSISINLLCTMLFDRELQCRRAASATFQELVGRQGTFNEEGINILNNLDYHNVGLRHFTYTKLHGEIVSYSPERYARPFVEHLLDKKVAHWDIQIRRLTSDSLPTLVPYLESPATIESIVIRPLMKMIDQNSDNNAKHGAILSLAKTVRHLAAMNPAWKFEQELIDFMGSIVKLCDKQLKSKQLAPNFIEAIGHVITSCEAASFDYPETEEEVVEMVKKVKISSAAGAGRGKEEVSKQVSVPRQWESVALSALDSDNSHLRDIGADALLTLYKTYYKRNKTCQDRLLTILNKSLNSLNESSRCGGLRALSKLSQAPDSYLETEVVDPDSLPDSIPGPHSMTATTEGVSKGAPGSGSRIRLDSDTPNIILMSITGYIAKETNERADNIVFAQAKAEACEALVNFVCALDKTRVLPLLNLIRASYDALLEKTEDYTLDKRGDIGVVVRQAAVKALLALTLHFQSINLTSILFADHDQPSGCLIQRIVTKLSQQSVSYHNVARELASTSFYKLVTLTSIPDNLIPHRAYILGLFAEFKVNDEFDWRSNSISIFVRLLSKEEYNLDLWRGLLPSLGQASDLGAKPFREALSDYIRSLSNNDAGKCSEELETVFQGFLNCLYTSDRIADKFLTSGLIAADYLLTQGLVNETSSIFQERLADFCWKSRMVDGANADPKRLVLVARVLCSMFQLPGKVQITCLKYCLQLLVNGYARVRVCTAEQFYFSVMTYEQELEENLTSGKVGEESLCSEARPSPTHRQVLAHGNSEEATEGAGGEETHQANSSSVTLDLQKAMELLNQTDWTEPLEKLKPIRDQISACFDLLP